MTTYKDTDLREALQRKYANTPQLSSDFMNRMHQVAQSKQPRASTPLHYGRLGSLEQPLNVAAAPQRGANPHSRRRAGWGWVCSIAAALLIAFLVWPESHKETTTQPEVKPIVAEADPQPVPQTIVEEEKDVVLAEVQQKEKPAKKRKKTVRKQNTPIEEPVEEIIPAEPVEELTIAMEPTSDSYAAIEAEMIDIRRRGERVEAMVADMTRSY